MKCVGGYRRQQLFRLLQHHCLVWANIYTLLLSLPLSLSLSLSLCTSYSAFQDNNLPPLFSRGWFMDILWTLWVMLQISCVSPHGRPFAWWQASWNRACNKHAWHTVEEIPESFSSPWHIRNEVRLLVSPYIRTPLSRRWLFGLSGTYFSHHFHFPQVLQAELLYANSLLIF